MISAILLETRPKKRRKDEILHNNDRSLLLLILLKEKKRYDKNMRSLYTTLFCIEKRSTKVEKQEKKVLLIVDVVVCHKSDPYLNPKKENESTDRIIHPIRFINAAFSIFHMLTFVMVITR